MSLAKPNAVTPANFVSSPADNLSHVVLPATGACASFASCRAQGGVSPLLFTDPYLLDPYLLMVLSATGGL